MNDPQTHSLGLGKSSDGDMYFLIGVSYLRPADMGSVRRWSRTIAHHNSPHNVL